MDEYHSSSGRYSPSNSSRRRAPASGGKVPTLPSLTKPKLGSKLPSGGSSASASNNTIALPQAAPQTSRTYKTQQNVNAPQLASLINSTSNNGNRKQQFNLEDASAEISKNASSNNTSGYNSQRKIPHPPLEKESSLTQRERERERERIRIEKEKAAAVPHPPQTLQLPLNLPSPSYSQSKEQASPSHSKGTSSSTAAAVAAAAANALTRPPPKPIKQASTPAETMRKSYDLLTPFEQSEILEYQAIYFVGSNVHDKIKGIPHTACNNGYDDERGDYRIVMGDHLEYRYEILEVLGRGSFGQVLKVIDHKKEMVVALKIIRNKKRFHHQALVEVKILEHLMGRDKEHKSNIVRVHGYFYFRNHLCITFEPLSINLYEFIKNNNFKGVSLGLIRRFAIQLLTSLKFLRQERIIHCDLKPENILLRSPNKSTIKLIDFGSSCFEDERVYTYIQSRFYRSPEVILGLPYDIAIDMWSFGCILSELYTGYPLFPGENEVEQFQCIMEILGMPPKRLIQECTRKKTFFDANMRPLQVPNSRGKLRQIGSKDLSVATKCQDPNFLSFLRRCLRWDPKVRMTPDKAFDHPFIAEVLKPKEMRPLTPSISGNQTTREKSTNKTSVNNAQHSARTAQEDDDMHDSPSINSVNKKSTIKRRPSISSNSASTNKNPNPPSQGGNTMFPPIAKATPMSFVGTNTGASSSNTSGHSSAASNHYVAPTVTTITSNMSNMNFKSNNINLPPGNQLSYSAHQLQMQQQAALLQQQLQSQQMQLNATQQQLLFLQQQQMQQNAMDHQMDID